MVDRRWVEPLRSTRKDKEMVPHTQMDKKTGLYSWLRFFQVEVPGTLTYEDRSLLCPICNKVIFINEYYVACLPQGYAHYQCLFFSKERKQIKELTKTVLRKPIEVEAVPVPIELDPTRSPILRYLKKRTNNYGES